MSIHPRKISIEAAIKNSDDNSGRQVLDPHALLVGIQSQFSTTDLPFTVKLMDGNESVAYSLNTFLSKDYEIESGKVKFGFKRLNIRRLQVAVVYEVTLESGGVVREGIDPNDRNII